MVVPPIMQTCAGPGDATDEFHFWRQQKFHTKSYTQFIRLLFKEINILILVSLYIMEVICYIRKHQQFVDLNSNIRTYITKNDGYPHPIIQY